LHEIAYEAPTTIAKAVSILGRHGERARPMCGGTDLLIQMRAGMRRPAMVVDVKQIKELREMKFDRRRGLRLGAAVPCAEIYESDVMRAHYPGLTEAAHLIGSVQIQSRASVGGNVCNGSPAADTIPALIALDAKARVAGPKARRLVDLENFVVAPGRTVLEPDEMLVEFLIPAPIPHSADAYLRFIPRNEMDIAVVGVGAALVLKGDMVKAARIALGAVAPTPIFARDASASLVGMKLDQAAVDEAARLAIEASAPIDDMRGTAEFRRHLVGVLTRRTLAIAAERARSRE
jgi:aerobic carbon-monoxide dehydrogenase medium subunit